MRECSNLGREVRVDKDVGGLEVFVDQGGPRQVQILHPLLFRVRDRA